MGGINADYDPALDAKIEENMKKQKQEEEYTAQLQAMAEGRGPSLASQMVQSQAQRNAAATNALIAGQRGGNTGLAMRQGLQANAVANQEAMEKAAFARTQEQLGAIGALGQNLNQRKAFELQQQAQTNQFNLANKQMQTGVDMQNAANTASLVGGAIGGGSAIGAAALMSDENQKTDIGDGSGDAYAFLDALNASRFKYKNPEAPGAHPGEQLGVMAQDIEQSPGRSMVMNTPNGKMINPSQGFGAVLAAQANLHDRLKRIEGGKGYAFGGYVDYSIPLKKGMGGEGLSDAGQGVAKMMMAQQARQPGVTPGPGEMIESQNPMLRPGTADLYNTQRLYAAHGAMVPGEAPVEGDSAQNDIVPAYLSPGEIVIPRSKAKDADKAKDFIDELMGRKKAKDEPGKSGYAKILEMHRKLGEALKGLE